jgi:DNA-directed RNA polymerase subunit RPC12/RpoP
MKILCSRCKRTVGMTVGNLVTCKRGQDRIMVSGQDYSVLTTCPHDCGEETAIIVKGGQLQQADLLTEEDIPSKQPNEKEGDQDGNKS